VLAIPERPTQAMFEVRRIVEACSRGDGDSLALMLRYKLHQTRVELLERLQLNDVVPLRPASSGQAAKRRASKAYHAARSAPR